MADNQPPDGSALQSKPEFDTAELAQKILEKVEVSTPEIVKGIPIKKQVNFARAILDKAGAFTLMAVQKTHIGPLPDPATLGEYNVVVPNGAERIFNEFEAQGKHRRNIEQKVIRSNNTQGYIGQTLAFVLAGGYFIGGFILVMNGHDGAGIAIFTTTIVGLAGVFVYGKKKQAESLSEKE